MLWGTCDACQGRWRACCLGVGSGVCERSELFGRWIMLAIATVPPWMVRPSSRLFFVAFAFTVASFLTAGACLRRMGHGTDEAALDIAARVAPSIARLSAARADLGEVLVRLDRLLDAANRGEVRDGTMLVRAR